MLACFCHKYPHTHTHVLAFPLCLRSAWRRPVEGKELESLPPLTADNFFDPRRWAKPTLAPFGPFVPCNWLGLNSIQTPTAITCRTRDRERGRVSSYSQMLLNPVYRLCGVWGLATAIGDLWSLTYRLLLSGILGPDCNCGFSILYQSLDPTDATAPSCPWTDRYTQHTASRWRIRSEVWLFH